jgi:hypothetical protein
VNADSIPQDPKDCPWDERCFIIAPERTYDRMGCIKLPLCHVYPFGADITYLIWRFDRTPDEWVTTLRIRSYAGPNTDPFTGGDRKRWTVGKHNDVAASRQAFSTMAKAAQMLLNGGKPVTHDIIELNGNSDVFWRILTEAKPDWMHVGPTISLPQKK